MSSHCKLYFLDEKANCLPVYCHNFIETHNSTYRNIILIGGVTLA